MTEIERVISFYFSLDTGKNKTKQSWTIRNYLTIWIEFINPSYGQLPSNSSMKLPKNGHGECVPSISNIY